MNVGPYMSIYSLLVDCKDLTIYMEEDAVGLYPLVRKRFYIDVDVDRVFLRVP